MTVSADPWTEFRRHTPARIALGRAGGSLPTRELLQFSLDHALARDAVHASLDTASLAEALGAATRLSILVLHSQAADRAAYLRRPDLGRRLCEKSRQVILQSAAGAPSEDGTHPVAETTASPDVAIVVGDGLSAQATTAHAASTLAELTPKLRSSGLTLAPICVVEQARVAIQDEIGSVLRAKASVILLGERPGLGTPDSLGAYLVYEPTVGRSDAERNCVSNIRPAGLPPAAAAETIHWLLMESLRRRLSGVALKDDRQTLTRQGNGTERQAGLPFQS